MKSKKVSALEVIRAYYISEELLGEIFKVSEKKRERDIEKILNTLIKKAKKVPQQKLLKNFANNSYSIRFDNYINAEWTLKEVMLADCGVWPRMGGLPNVATKSSLVDTADYLCSYLEDKNKLTLKLDRVLYVEEMMKWAEDITKKIPIIVLEDGLIRHNRKLGRPSRTKGYKKCKYDIDDGNHRALALALLGKKKVRAYVGKRKYRSDLLYD